MFQTSAKSLPNLKSFDFFCQNLEEKSPCPDTLFFVQISFLLQFCEISKYAPLIAIHFWLGWWADKIRVSNPVARHILRKIEPWNIIAPYFSSRFRQNKHLFAKKRQFGRIWKKKQLREEIKRGTSKSPPNSFQIENLEATIWTFEQIDKLRQSPNCKNLTKNGWFIKI